jgi:hypothetical protein
MLTAVLKAVKMLLSCCSKNSQDTAILTAIKAVQDAEKNHPHKDQVQRLILITLSQIVVALHHPLPPQPLARCWEGSHQQRWREDRRHRHCNPLAAARGRKGCACDEGGKVEVEVVEVAGVVHCHLQRQSRVIA